MALEYSDLIINKAARLPARARAILARTGLRRRRIFWLAVGGATVLYLGAGLLMPLYMQQMADGTLSPFFPQSDVLPGVTSWGVTILIVLWPLLLLPAVVGPLFAREKEAGTLESLLLTPLDRLQIARARLRALRPVYGFILATAPLAVFMPRPTIVSGLWTRWGLPDVVWEPTAQALGFGLVVVVSALLRTWGLSWICLVVSLRARSAARAVCGCYLLTGVLIALDIIAFSFHVGLAAVVLIIEALAIPIIELSLLQRCADRFDRWALGEGGPIVRVYWDFAPPPPR